MKRKIRLPIIVCRDGFVVSAGYASSADGEEDCDVAMALDCLPEDSYESGHRTVYITAEIDIEKVFADLDVQGEDELAVLKSDLAEALADLHEARVRLGNRHDQTA